MRLFAKYLLSSVARDTAGGGSGAAAGGAGAGPGAGAGAAGGAAAGGEPFYSSWGLDADGAKYIADKGFKGPGDVVKVARDMERVARDRNVIERWDPKDPKGWKGWGELGWVEDAAKYDIKAPDPKSIKFTYDGELWGEFKKTCHENRVPLPAAQAAHDAMMKFWGGRMDQITARGEGAQAELTTALRKEWGGDYDGKVELAKRAAKSLGLGIDDSAELEKMIGSPRLTKLFASIGAKLGEGSLDAGGGNANAMTKEQAGAALRKLEGDREWIKVFNDRRHPQNGDYIAQRQRLINIMAGLPG